MVPMQAQCLGFGIKSLEVGAEERAEVAFGWRLEGLKWDKMAFIKIALLGAVAPQPFSSSSSSGGRFQI